MNDVVAYIAADNPSAALKVLDRLEEASERLGEMAIGRRGRVSGTFEKPIPNLPYIIAYAIRPQPVGGELVVILRIIHTARDWPKESWPERSGRGRSRRRRSL
jgi:plasmid stabilization system protein ParE